MSRVEGLLRQVFVKVASEVGWSLHDLEAVHLTAVWSDGALSFIVEAQAPEGGYVMHSIVHQPEAALRAATVALRAMGEPLDFTRFRGRFG